MRSKDKKNLLYNRLIGTYFVPGLCIVCVLSVMLFLQTPEGQGLSSKRLSSSPVSLNG